MEQLRAVIYSCQSANVMEALILADPTALLDPENRCDQIQTPVHLACNFRSPLSLDAIQVLIKHRP